MNFHFDEYLRKDWRGREPSRKSVRPWRESADDVHTPSILAVILAPFVIGVVFAPFRHTIEMRGLFGEIPAEIGPPLIDRAGVVVPERFATGMDHDLFSVPRFDDADTFVKVEIPFGILIEFIGKLEK